MIGRKYRAYIVADELKGCKDVMIDLFRAGSLEQEEKNYNWLELIKRYDEANFCIRDYILRQCLTIEEVEDLRKWFKTHCDLEVKSYIEKFPIPNNLCSFGALAVDIGGEPQGWIYFWHWKGYDLPFKISGYYDLRRHEKAAKVKQGQF